MKLKRLSEENIAAIDDHASSMMEIPGVLQVFAGYGKLMKRLPELSADGSLVIMIDAADTFVRRCFEVFNAERFPCEYASSQPPPNKIETMDRQSGYCLAQRAVVRIKIDKIGAFLSSAYRVNLYLTAGGSIVRFVEYDASSPHEIFAYLKAAMR